MMKSLVALLAATAAALSPAWAAPPPPNAFAQRILKLDPARQKAVLRQAITNDGERCGHIGDTSRVPPYKNLAGWSARCTPGGDYLIFVGPDGSAQVRRCEDARKLKLPGCPPPEPPAKKPARK